MQERGKSDPGYEADSLTCVAGCRPVHCHSEREGTSLSLMMGTRKINYRRKLIQTDSEQILHSMGGKRREGGMRR